MEKPVELTTKTVLELLILRQQYQWSICQGMRWSTLPVYAAQHILDEILKGINLYSTDVGETTLYNGWKLKISQQFSYHNGHSLETLYKTQYPFLNSYQKEDALKKDIIEKILNDYPQYTPLPLFEAIKRIK